VTVSGLTAVRAVSAGKDFACAVLQNGLAWCWGHNDHGQIGNGTNTQAFALPVAVQGLTNVSVIAAADDHACALRTDGTAWCWGENNERQLGDGTSMERNSPVTVLGLAGVRAVALACGGNHCCVALADGAVRCWGDNASGQLGDNTTTDRDRATAVSGLLGVSALSTRGTGQTCALGSGVLRCWGLNDGGQLGIGNTTSQRLPVTLSF
jgi:alpha-tubulin suppressor-like RCC1 family protein